MHSEISKYLKNKKPLPESIYKIVRKKGFVTGSLVYGGWNKETSDIDCVIRSTHVSFDRLMQWGFYLSNDYAEDNRQYLSIYVKNESGAILNILVMQNEYIYRTWRKAHNIMLKLINIPFLRKAFKDKQIRVAMFELLKRIYRDDHKSVK